MPAQCCLPTPAWPAGPAPGEEIETHPIADLRCTIELLYCVTDLHDDAGRLMAGRNRIPLLVAGEEPTLERADSAGSNLYDNLLGTRCWIRLIAELDCARTGDHCNFHDASITRRRRGKRRSW